LDAIDFAQMRKSMDDWQVLADCFYGDFYPLTPYTLAEDQWMAWQYHRPEQDAGAIQVFRRKDSVYEAARLRLRGLQPNENYRLTDIDTGPLTAMTGEQLMEHGLLATLPLRPQASILVYERAE
jgi:alpha-galactosidase